MMFLSPLPFIIHQNDIHNNMNCNKSFIYVEDTTFVTSNIENKS